MKKVLLTILLLSLNAFAQQKFEITNASKKFDVTMEISSCNENNHCAGETSFYLRKKNEIKDFQVIKLENSAFYLDGDSKKTTVKVKQIPYGKHSVLYLEDFNFDGLEDLALRDGNNGGYHGPSYQVYLFSAKQNKFVQNKSFTELAQGPYLGFFQIDYKEKTITTLSKSGCCCHQLQKFRVLQNKPKMFYEMTKDAMLGDGFVRIETKKLVNNKWEVSEKKEKMEDN